MMAGESLSTIQLSERIERVLIDGDLSPLSPDERVQYYNAVCQSVGLNPLTKPFLYIKLNGKLVLYASRDCTDQLRKINKVSVRITGRERIEDVYIVTACATLPDGRTDESTGAVSLAGLRGDALGNALMKAETKGKRRVTLSICGLGWLDETEIETIPSAKIVDVTERGDIVDDNPDIKSLAAENGQTETVSESGGNHNDVRIKELEEYISQLGKSLDKVKFYVKSHYKKDWENLSPDDIDDLREKLAKSQK